MYYYYYWLSHQRLSWEIISLVCRSKDSKSFVAWLEIDWFLLLMPMLDSERIGQCLSSGGSFKFICRYICQSFWLSIILLRILTLFVICFDWKMRHHHHHHHHHLFWKHSFLPRYARVSCLPIWSPFTYPWLSLIQDVNQALSWSHTQSLSKSSYSSRNISPLPPPPFYRVIPSYPHSYAPVPIPPQSATPHHTLYTQRLYKSTLRFLSFSDTLHIHLTIIRSVLSRLCRFAFFIAQDPVPYINTLWTQALYIFPFMQYEDPELSG